MPTLGWLERQIDAAPPPLPPPPPPPPLQHSAGMRPLVDTLG
jgi:hypothetical protein